VNVPEAQTVSEAQPGSVAPGSLPVGRRLPRPGIAIAAAARRVRAWPHPLHAALVAVVALAAVLDFNRLSQNGFANIFYSAAVKSELHSWHNFLYLSSDPGGFISVDKTPLGVWLQVASAKLFGFSAMSLLVPEAVVGVLAVALLYGIVARRCGRLAGVAAALALAVFPSFVAVARDNGPDPLLVLFMLVACGAALRATETGRWRWLLATAVAVGLAFNTKGLAALLVVPGIVAAYALCAEAAWWRRGLHLLGAGIVVVVISGAWIAVVELTPGSHRPYVGGSTDNSEVNLTFQYNGVGRVGGQVGGPGRVPHARPLSPTLARALSPTPAIPRTGHARFPTAFGPGAGPTRLGGIGLGDQGGWFLPFAAFGLVAIALTLRRARGADRTADGPARRDPRLGLVLVLGGWFAVEAVVLSFSKGIVHPYYVSALAPGAAAMAGAGAVAMAQLVRNRRWLVVLPLLAAAATLLMENLLLGREHWHQSWIPILAAAAAAALILALVRRSWTAPAVVALLAILLVVPTAYSTTVWSVPVEGTFPAAGPHVAAGHGGVGVTPKNERVNLRLLDYVRSHGGGTRWDLFTLSSDTAAPLTLLGGRAAAIGGYSGTDPTLTGPGLARLVAHGEVRYLLLGGAYAERGGNAASRAAEHLCRDIPSRTWLGYGRATMPLFDCGGSAGLLATEGAGCPAACEQPARRVAPAAVRPARGPAARRRGARALARPGARRPLGPRAGPRGAARPRGRPGARP
jgi:4-amino-4-deoxy-L-arabinose transferase-like glycosyltransferase